MITSYDTKISYLQCTEPWFFHVVSVCIDTHIDCFNCLCAPNGLVRIRSKKIPRDTIMIRKHLVIEKHTTGHNVKIGEDVRNYFSKEFETVDREASLQKGQQ